MTPDSSCVATCRPSPNFGDRRSGPTDILLLHYTGMPDADQAADWLCNPESEVSSHYFVHEDGTMLQFVPEAARAWHAGAGCWKGESDINSRSIGIEIANAGHPAGLPDFPDAQIEAVIALCTDILARHSIPPDRVLGHSDVAPGRKIDPGEKFPWDRLAAAGIGHFVLPEPLGGGRFLQENEAGEPVAAWQSMLGAYGYEVGITGVFDARTKAVTEAFQRHFRPARVDGVADESSITTLYRLLGGVGAIG